MTAQFTNKIRGFIKGDCAILNYLHAHINMNISKREKENKQKLCKKIAIQGAKELYNQGWKSNAREMRVILIQLLYFLRTTLFFISQSYESYTFYYTTYHFL